MPDQYRPYPVTSDDFAEKVRLVSMSLIYFEALCNNFRVVLPLGCENLRDLQKADLGGCVSLVDREALAEGEQAPQAGLMRIAMILFPKNKD